DVELRLLVASPMQITREDMRAANDNFTWLASRTEVPCEFRSRPRPSLSTPLIAHYSKMDTLDGHTCKQPLAGEHCFEVWLADLTPGHVSDRLGLGRSVKRHDLGGRRHCLHLFEQPGKHRRTARV